MFDKTLTFAIMSGEETSTGFYDNLFYEEFLKMLIPVMKSIKNIIY